jgi:transcriptional regulator with XRE-family HTH domain
MQDAVPIAAAATRASGVGADLRALRKARGLNLSELALKVGRSVGWLSQVERDLAEPTISDLRRLSSALDQPLSLFFGPNNAPEDERGHVVRWNSRRALGSAEQGLVEQLDPVAELPEFNRRATEEAGYLIAGELELWIGERHFHLKPGDSFRFKGERHRWRNPGSEPAIAIWVIAPPVY